MSAVPVAEAKSKGPRQKLISPSESVWCVSVSRGHVKQIHWYWFGLQSLHWGFTLCAFQQETLVDVDLVFFTRPAAVYHTAPSHKDQSRKSTGRFRGDPAPLLTSLSLQKMKILAFVETEPYFVQMSTKTWYGLCILLTLLLTFFCFVLFYLLLKSLSKQFSNTSVQLLGGKNTCNMDFKPRKQMDEW